MVLLLTEWNEYVTLDPGKLGQLLKERRIIDGRNCLEPAAWRDAGWLYRALGRPELRQALSSSTGRVSAARMPSTSSVT